MVVTVMKNSYQKTQLKITVTAKISVNIFLGSHYKTSSHKFGKQLWYGCWWLFDIYNNILDQNAPGKKKYVRVNHSPFMNKNLSEDIMLGIKLRNIFLENRTQENKGRYTKQNNLCVTLLWATIKNFGKQLKHYYQTKLSRMRK